MLWYVGVVGVLGFLLVAVYSLATIEATRRAELSAGERYQDWLDTF